MIRIDPQFNIQITRGDDEVLTIDLIDLPGNTPHHIVTGETLKMTVRSGDMLTEVGTRSKAFTLTSSQVVGNTYATISIPGSQTRALTPGRYVYDIELRGTNPSRATTIVGGDKSHLLEFYVVEDVTLSND